MSPDRPAPADAPAPAGAPAQAGASAGSEPYERAPERPEDTRQLERPDRDGGHEQTASRFAMRRRNGAVAAGLLLLAGLWVGSVPFLGPYFGYGFDASPAADTPVFTLDRLWLTTLPAIAIVLGGVILGPSRHRATGALGALLALLGGVWLVVGPAVSRLWGAAGPGAEIGIPIGPTWMQVLAQLSVFYGIGVLVVILAAVALARLTARSARV